MCPSRYPNLKDITVQSPIYDESFVIERGTPKGQLLPGAKEVFEVVARSLLVDIGTPVGARTRSARANIQTNQQIAGHPLTKACLHEWQKLEAMLKK